MAAGDTVIKALLTLNVANFLSSLNQANKATKDTTTTMGKISSAGEAITGVGTTLTKNVTLPIVTLGAKAVQTAADFEAAMSTVQALSGATGEDFDALSVKAREMGAGTVYSATESAEAFQYMALAGWDTEQMLAAIEPILYLAGGGMMDLGTTSDIVTDNLTAFGLTAADTERFTDVLAQTMRSSNTDVLQMGEAFKYVAPLAGTLGFTIEDTSLALGLMANSGIKASSAGTSLRGALTNLVAPTDKMQGVMTRYGIEVTNADGSMRTLREIMDNLRSSFATMTKEQQEAAFASIEQAVGADLAAKSLEGLTGDALRHEQQMAVGQDAIKDWTEEQIKASAATLMSKAQLKEYSDEQIVAAVAAEQGRQALEGLTESEAAAASANLFGKNALSGMLAIVNASEDDYNNLAAAIDSAEGSTKELYEVSQDNLKGSLANLNSAWEELLIVIGEKLIPVLVPLIDRLIEIINYIATLDQSTIETAILIAGIVAVVGPLLVILGNVISIIGAVGTVIGALSAPILIIIGVIAALAAGFIYLWNTNEDFRNGIIEIWGNIKEFVVNAVEAIAVFFTETLPQAIEELVIWFQELPQRIVDAITGLYERIVEWGANVAEAFVTWATTTVDNIVTWFQALPGRILEALNLFVTETIPEWLAFVRDAFFTGINGIVDFIIYLFSVLPFQILIAIRDTVISIVTWGEEVLEKADEVITDLIENIIEWFSTLPDRIYNAIVNTIDTITTWMSETKDAASTAITDFIESVGQWFSELPGKIYDAITSTVDSIVTWGEDISDKAQEVIGDFIDDAMDWFADLPERVVSIGSDIVEGIWNGITSMGDWISGKIDTFCTNIYNGIVDFFDIGSPSKLMAKEVGRWIPPGIAVGMEDSADSILPATQAISDEMALGLNSNIAHTMESFTDNMSNAVSAITSATSGIGRSLLTATSNLGDAVQSPIMPQEETVINIGEIIVRDENDLTMLSRGLFNRDVATLRGLGRA